MKEASTVAYTSPVGECPVDASGPDSTRFAGGHVVDVAVVLHRAVLPHVRGVAGRDGGPAGAAHGVRNADRGGPGPGVASQPGALVLLPRPVEHRTGRSGAGRVDRGRVAARGRAGAGRGGRHVDAPQRPEGRRGGVAARRGPQGAQGQPSVLGHLLRGGRDRRGAAVPGLAGVPAGAGPAVAPEGHLQGGAGLSGGAGGAPTRRGLQGRGLPAGVSLTSRLRRNAVLHAIATPIPGRGGRPRRIGARLGAPADLARTGVWHRHTVHRYGRTDPVLITETVCLWYGTYRSRAVRVVLVREPGSTAKSRDDLALVTTDLHSPATQIVSRYAARWAIEVAFEDARQITGVGEARNRTPTAVARTVPFGLITQSLVIVWYTHHGHTPRSPKTAAHRHPGTAPRPNPPTST